LYKKERNRKKSSKTSNTLGYSIKPLVNTIDNTSVMPHGVLCFTIICRPVSSKST
jgi:hypothetical protein